jgi:hypothetical protein
VAASAGRYRCAMTAAEMRAWVKSITDQIEGGPPGSSQRRFKFFVNADLRNALGPKAVHPEWTVAQVLDAAAAQVGVPGFVPQYRDPSVRLLDWPERARSV